MKKKMIHISQVALPIPICRFNTFLRASAESSKAVRIAVNVVHIDHKYDLFHLTQALWAN